MATSLRRLTTTTTTAAIIVPVVSTETSLALAGTRDGGLVVDAAFLASWDRWRIDRDDFARSSHGPATLIVSHHLGPEPESVPGVAGRWRVIDGEVRGDGLGSSSLAGSTPSSSEAIDEIRVRPGDTRLVGRFAIRAFAQGGSLALRIHDPEAPARGHLRGMLAFTPDPRWVVPGDYEPAGPSDTMVLETVDGRSHVSEVGGHLTVRLPTGESARIVVHETDSGLMAVFGDAGNGSQSYRFRFLELPLPDRAGRTTVDFNRAYLPPCAFSDLFACPFPPPDNRLGSVVPAGERGLVMQDGTTTIGGLAAAVRRAEAPGA